MAGAGHAVDHSPPALETPHGQANASTEGSTANYNVEYASHDEVAYGPTGPGISPEFAHQFMLEHTPTYFPTNAATQTALLHEQDPSHALAADADYAHGDASHNIFSVDVRSLQNPVLGFGDVGEHHGGHVIDTTGS